MPSTVCGIGEGFSRALEDFSFVLQSVVDRTTLPRASFEKMSCCVIPHPGGSLQ